MKLPEGATIIGEIDGGRRNHIDLGSMFGNDCKSVEVRFHIVENNGKQAVYRTDSEPEAKEMIIADFDDRKYLANKAQDQFIPVDLPQGEMELFDCRAGKAVLKEYEAIEIVKAFTRKDTTFQERCNEWHPALLRMALCKIKKAGKFGLIIVISADDINYGFGTKDFNVTSQQQPRIEPVYDSIEFDEKNLEIITVKDGETARMPMN